MRILIVGGTNFIGHAVTEQLVGAGHDVTLFHRGETESDALPEVPHIHGDRARLQEFRSDVERAAPDVVLDMAPMTADDARAVISVSRGIAKRVVAISSIDVYRAYGRLHGTEPGPVEPMPLTEDSPLRDKLYPYLGKFGGKLDRYDKIPAEQAAMSLDDLPGSIVRLPAVYGERDYQHRLFMELVRMDANRPAILAQQDQLNWRWPRGYVGNCAHAIALVVTSERAAGRIYHVAEPETATQHEWLLRVARLAGWSGNIIPLPREQLPAHLQAQENFGQDLVVDSSRIRRELGYTEVVPPDEWLMRAIAWERAHPPERVNSKWTDFAAEDEAIERTGRSGHLRSH